MAKEKKTIEIICETPDYIVVNKPCGVSVTADRTGEASLPKLLGDVFPGRPLFTVHRLDKPTSGVLIMAFNPETHRALCELFSSRQVTKTYLALVSGAVLSESGRIDDPIAADRKNAQMMKVDHRKGKDAYTDYEVLATFGTYSLLAVRPETGRTHQIRVHLTSIGLPIVCDPMYGSERPLLLSDVKPGYKIARHKTEERPLLERLGLHAYQLNISIKGEMKSFVAPPDKKFIGAIKMLTKHNPQGINAFTNPEVFEAIVEGRPIEGPLE